MRTFKTRKLSGLNVTIYLILIFIFLAFIGFVWNFTNDIIINPEELKELHIERPVISPFNDAYLFLKSEILNNDKSVYQRIQTNLVIWQFINGLIFLTLLFLLILQLKKLLYSIKQKPFFLSENLKTIRRISYLLGIWVIIKIILYHSFQLFIPLSIVRDNYNYIPINEYPLIGLLASINYSLLMAAFAFYVISVVFKEGQELKEQSDLTI